MSLKKAPETTRRPNRGLITTLPAEGLGIPASDWPLEDLRPGEKKRWEAMWETPQAYAWHLLRTERVVARYVRLALRAENSGGDGSGVTFQGELRRLEHELGFTPRAMHLLNWRVADGTTPKLSDVSDLEAYRRALGEP